MTYPSITLYPSTALFPGSTTGGGGVVVGGYRPTVTCIIGGVVTTGTDSAGCMWAQDTLTGWYGSPATTLNKTAKARAAGAWSSVVNFTDRPITLAGTTDCPDGAACTDAMTRLTTATAPTSFVMTVADESGTRSAIVARDAASVDVTRVSLTAFVWSMQLAALDPRKFTAAVTGSTRLPSVTGGVAFPVVFPLAFNTTVVSGLVTLTNPGNATGPVVLRIDGPVTGPVVTHVGSGLQVAFGSSLTIAAGDWLEVDMEAQTALANGQANRSGSITSRGWSGFEPGPNLWAFTAVTGSPTATLTVTATPSWL